MNLYFYEESRDYLLNLENLFPELPSSTPNSGGEIQNLKVE